MAAIRNLGYVIMSAVDLAAWKEFACDFLGLQAAEFSEDRLLLRMDEKAYRLDVRPGEADAVTALGWEVAGPAELEELARKLEAAGYAVKREDESAARERQVSALVSFDDPDGHRLELFYGQKKERSRFVSPTGARFVTGDMGLGHVFQMVADNEAFRRLYLEILGCKLSDYIDFAGGFTGTFTHCNPRHHSIAFAAIPNAPKRFGHVMFQVDDLDLVGRAYDRAQDGAAKIVSTLGKHSNDEMLSFYVSTPGGSFQVEYGYGGVEIDDSVWRPARYDVTAYWGHKRTA